MTEKLSLKHSLQWLSLFLLKQQPLTADECYEKLNEMLPPPPQPGSPKRRYSKDKVRAYLKELDSAGAIISVKDAGVTSYSITKKGYAEEKERRQNLVRRMDLIHQSLQSLLRLMRGQDPLDTVLVPKEDREFVRSLITVKDVIRFYLIDALQKGAPDTLTNLQHKMLTQYGWTSSHSYFLLIGRNEMCEGVDIDNEPLEAPVILLKSQYGGKANRRYTREYSLIDPVAAESWKEIYGRDAAASIQEALTFTKQLLTILQKERGGE
ncbi:hypothetical protein BpOF4_21744 (plasmid) [Alkalihalophilus pseudofirmus OF4]|uniref:Uncharacterized protein n=1 Tax=Alkalihalophilus pseudofirmus (strain ATCC BAA-2126 / JCM 17055 / OF4) TaxID=398511 RepID=D3G1W8_ALKPO|nr:MULTISPECIES: hypothetical protein [Alkalihalophilus]ADC52344.1 hypothetical protein BpOF4_21744 [Alkalihalophilus pseudofirmus OF4]MED1602970.1 hypothetical protein [Alkalihalophilus marmarensis]